MTALALIGGGLAALTAALSLPSATGAEAPLTLVRNGRSNYRIILSTEASPSEKRAASELQDYLHRISDARLPIVTDDGPPGEREILLGNSRHLRRIGAAVDFERLGDDGFTLRTVGPHLVIAGGRERGTLYGVYAFLEEVLGCRWYTTAVSRIPRQRTLVVPPLEDTQVPELKYREVYYAGLMDPALADRLKLNGNASVPNVGKPGLAREKHRGWGTWCHTFFTYVPPGRYFMDHPEYFALVKGKRQTTQLCLTNPDVFRITVAELRRRMKEQPEDRIWDVSQNDTGGNCECEACRALDEREGTPMGSLLTFVNRVAAEFPDKTISTLSYQYTRKPPKTLRPAPNVAIMLCDIECTRSRPIPLSDHPADAAFRADVEAWSRIADRLYLWDYVVCFGHLVSPHPNLRIQQPNLRFFRDHKLAGLFAQGSREAGGEFSELRGYLLAKLLWNPDLRVDEVIDDFLAGYYGPAALPLRRYIDLSHDALERSGQHLTLWDGPAAYREGFLAPDLLRRYDGLFDEAERLVAHDPDLLLRVQTARMPLMYAELELGYGDPAARRALAERLLSLAERTGLLMFNEWDLTAAKYRDRVLK